MVIKILNGHSGCKVMLCHEEKVKYVRKISPSVDYNHRLISQLEKQKKFLEKNDKISVPKVLKKGYSDKLFYFDMEYINGSLMSDFIKNSEMPSVDPYLGVIQKYLNPDEKIKSQDITSLVKEKLRVLKKVSLNHEDYVKKILESDWKNIPTGPCHGDFTLENLIVSHGKIYFIDFLDTFAETKLLDMSKILFDVRYFWSKRHVKRKTIVKNMQIESMITNTDLYKAHHDVVNSLVMLDILRILPYSKEDKLTDYLERCLKHASRQ